MSDSKALEPRDEHNIALEKSVKPPDWVNPEPNGRYNLVVIGAGTAGLVCAAGAAGLGAKVALIERDLMGGDCLNVGCVPSKGIISSARIAQAVKDAKAFGVNVPDGVSVNFGEAMRRMRKLRAKIAPNDSAERFRDLGIDVFLGNARFTGEDTVEVDGKTLTFKRAVIASGARASAPPIPGLKDVDYLTNETLFSLTERPRRLGIIGAGPIGCEMAQSFARFGSEVLLVEAMHGILPREDRDAAECVQRTMESDGVKILCCGKDLKLSRADGGVRMTVGSHDKGYDEVVDQLLVAVGRAPNVEGLDLEIVGVEYTKKGVKVNDRLQTTNPNIYAAGDICSPYQFTHAADFMARIVIQNALFFGRAKASALVIPWCTYTEPEIAHVGLYEKEAQEKGIDVDTFTQELGEVDRAILEGQTNGFVRVHLKKGTDEIVGATIVATNAGDMISEFTLAMTNKLGLKRIAAAIHPYPTQAEAIRRVGDLYNRTRLTPRVKSIMQTLLKWRR
ncbi:MAG: mercuric reductase [Verrucomicrobia bacterium]|nr:mercuric reductase [Verrucomicrobiota bacterium]